MIYRSNLTCPDLTPHFKHLVSRPMGHSFGHDVPSDWGDKAVDDPVFGLYKNCGMWSHDEAAILCRVSKLIRGVWLEDVVSLDIYLEAEYGTVFEANVTHNLGRMADEAGVYGILWRPEENGVTYAKDLREKIESGIAAMKAEPERFLKYNPENGWGSFAEFVPWLQELLAACVEYPDAIVRISR